MPMEPAMAMQSVGVGGDMVDIVLDFVVVVLALWGADCCTCDTRSNPENALIGGDDQSSFYFRICNAPRN